MPSSKESLNKRSPGGLWTRREALKLLGVGGAGAVLSLYSPLNLKADNSYRVFLPLIGKNHENDLPPEINFPVDLNQDVIEKEKLPVWMQERLAREEKTGVLGREYYAVSTSVIEIQSDLNEKRPFFDEELIIGRLYQLTNNWLSGCLGKRELRFEGEIEKIQVPLGQIAGTLRSPDAKALVGQLLERVEEDERIGQNQKLKIIFIKDIKGVAINAGNVIFLSLPDSGEESDLGSKTGILAHLLGHALGLDHPLLNPDTEGTVFNSGNSFMSPSIKERELAGARILDSQLNPEKARLLASGFFPYEGRIYLEDEGAIPLEKGIILSSERYGPNIKVAHGLYLLETGVKEVAVTIKDNGIEVDFGSAILRQEKRFRFTSSGEHLTYGTGILVEAGQGGIIKGGIILGYHYGLLAKDQQGMEIEGVTAVNGRRIWYDASRSVDEEARGLWLDFWYTPENDLLEGVYHPDPDKPVDSYSAYGSRICLINCQQSLITKTLLGHSTVGLMDFFGRSNHFEENDFSECAMGLRLWGAKGTDGSPILIKDNIFHFNTQPVPGWYNGGDGAAILGAGIEFLKIEGNEINFGGDGIFFVGLPFFPGEVKSLTLIDNKITDCFAHGIELDFCQETEIKRNQISRNWLSGIWAGHASGVLIVDNLFEQNNLGRYFSQWTQSQGAISCPEGGRTTIVRNQFSGNWVAVNCWQDFWLPGWFFSGDSDHYAITGNTFQGNRVAVRMNQVSDSLIARNRLEGNVEDLVVEGACQNNLIEDNHDRVNPSDHFSVVHFSRPKVVFGQNKQETTLPVVLVTPGGESEVAPERVEIVGKKGNNQWLRKQVLPDGRVKIVVEAGSDFAGAESSQVTLAYGGKEIKVPVKFFSGNYAVVAGKGEFDLGFGRELGRTDFPGARFGLFAPISKTLKTPLETPINGLEPFWINFWRDEKGLSFPSSCPELLMVVLSEGEVKLWLLPQASNLRPGGEEGLVYSGVSPDLPWESYQTKRVSLKDFPGGKARFLYQYSHQEFFPQGNNPNPAGYYPAVSNFLFLPMEAEEVVILNQKLSGIVSTGHERRGSFSEKK